MCPMFPQLESPLRLVTSHMVLNSPLSLLNQVRASSLNIMDSFKDSFPIKASFLNSIQDNFLNIMDNSPSISSFRGNFKDNNFLINNSTQDSFSSFKGNFHNMDSSLNKVNTILALVNNSNSNRRMDPEDNSRHHQDSCPNSLGNSSWVRMVNSNS